MFTAALRLPRAYVSHSVQLGGSRRTRTPSGGLLMAIDTRPAGAHVSGQTGRSADHGVPVFGLIIAVAVLAAAAAASSVLYVRGAPTVQVLAPPGVLVLGGLIWLACYRFEWFVLTVLALRTAMDATRATPAGTHLASTVSKAPDAVTSGPIASAMAVLFIVMSTVWLLALRREGGRTPLSVAQAAFGAFVAACLFSVSGAVNRTAALSETARILAAVMMFVVLVKLVTTLAQVRRTLIACAVGFVAPVALGLAQASGGGGDFRSADLNRIVGTFLHPNTFGLFLTMFILLSAAVFRHCTRPAQWVLGTGIAVCAGLLVLTYSRGAWIALVVGLLLVGVLQSRAILAWLFGAAVLLLIAVPSVAARVSDLGGRTPTNNGSESSLVWRFQYWQEIWKLNRDNPITGIGLKGTKYLTDQNKAPHNDFLRAYVETGVLGLLAYVLVLLALAGIARQALRNAAPGFPRGVAIGFTAVLTAYVLDSLADNLISEVVVLWYFYAAAACAYAVSRLGARAVREATV